VLKNLPPSPAPENRAVYKIMWKNMVEPEKTQITIKCGTEKMRFSCRITKARKDTHTHSLTLTILNAYCFIID